jgi:hypothetical protein
MSVWKDNVFAAVNHCCQERIFPKSAEKSAASWQTVAWLTAGFLTAH